MLNKKMQPMCIAEGQSLHRFSHVRLGLVSAMGLVWSIVGHTLQICESRRCQKSQRTDLENLGSVGEVHAEANSQFIVNFSCPA